MEVEVIKKNDATSKRKKFDFNSKLRVAAYCRVSTASKEQKDSYQSQVKHYTHTIKSNKNWVFVDVYADEAMTGTIANKRTDLLRLINDAMDGKIDLILTKSIARFARNTVDTLNYVRMLKEKNVAIYFEEEHINTLEMAGELLLTILSSVAQQEVQNTSDNVKLGITMKMIRGEMIGANNCYGYKIKGKTLVIIEKEAKVVRLIYTMYIDGYGAKAIAQELERRGIKTRKGNTEWNPATITRILQNVKYAGHLLMRKTITIDPIAKIRIPNNGEEDMYFIKNHHPAIISQEMFDKAQEIRKERAKNYADRNFVGEKGKNYSFTGKMYCAFCNSIYTRVTYVKPNYFKEVWKCHRADKKSRKECPDSYIITNDAMENIFIDLYNSLCVKHEKTIDKALKIIEEAIEKANDNGMHKNIEKEIKEILSKIDQLVELKLDNQIESSVYEKKYNELNAELETLRKEQLEEQNSKVEKRNTKDRIKEYRKLFDKSLMINEFDKELFNILVQRVIVGEIDEDGNKNPYIITIVMSTNTKRRFSYFDYDDSNKVKKNINVTPNILSKNFRPSLLCNTV